MLTALLYFTVARELKRKNKLPKQPKMKGTSFYSIIEDFKTQTEENNGINLSVVSGTPHYEGSYSRVIGGARTRERNRYSCRKREWITFSEFMKKKI